MRRDGKLDRYIHFQSDGQQVRYKERPETRTG